jgi:hypothetical protein
VRGREPAGLLLAATVAVGVSFGLSRLAGGPTARFDALAASPADARAVLWVRAPAVLESPLATRALGGGQGTRRIERLCGYDPLGEVDDVVVTLSDRGAPAVLARGPLAAGAAARARLVECLGRVLEEQGRAVERTTVGGVDAVASTRGDAHAAFVGPDGVAAGGREDVAHLVAVEAGRAPGADTDLILRSLYDELRDGPTPPDALAVARPDALPAELRASLVGVTALGARARLRDGVHLEVRARADDDAVAARLQTALRAQRDRVLENPLLRLTALGRILADAEVEAEGRDVRLTVDASERQVAQLLQMIHALERLRELGASLPGPEQGPGAEEEEEEEPSP